MFRVRIHYHRELLLLKDAVSKAKGSEEARLKRRLVDIERELVSLPLLTSRLNGSVGVVPYSGKFSAGLNFRYQALKVYFRYQALKVYFRCML